MLDRRSVTPVRAPSRAPQAVAAVLAPALAVLGHCAGRDVRAFVAAVRSRVAPSGEPSALAVAAAPAGEPAYVHPPTVLASTPPFALTSYARARLLRQLHATGLLSCGAAAAGVAVAEEAG